MTCYDGAILRTFATVSYGGRPDGSETDYDVWCASCRVFLWHGLQCDDECDAGDKCYPASI